MLIVRIDLTRIRGTFVNLIRKGMPPPCRRSVIQWTADDHARFVEYVGINHGRGHVFVAEQFLHSSDIITVFQQMRSKTMPEGVAACRLPDSRALDRGFDCFLKVFLGNVVTTRFARAWVGGGFRGWENVLPRPGAARIYVLAFQREGQINAASAVAQLMKFLHTFQVEPERVAQTFGQNCDSVA